MRILSLVLVLASGLSCGRSLTAEEPSRWDNFYVEGGVGNGRTESLGGISLFGPLYSTEEGFLFTDLRGIWGDRLDAVQSYGFGGRFLNDQDFIRGMYAFYDHQRSTTETTHQQLSIGAEVLTIDWDFRINAYLPNKKFSQSHSYGDLNDGEVVVRGLTENSYYGADTEFGYLLHDWREGLVELRGYVGGYWFDRNYDGFEAIYGPRARAELRLFDLEWLGPGSRLVAAGQADWNRRDKTQLTALLTLRVPLQLKKSKPLSRIDRRMLNPIARWPGVFLNTLWTVEPAAFADGRAISETLTIDANTPSPESAVHQLPRNSLVIIDGSEGAIGLEDSFVMHDGQALLGGEGFLEVVGRTTGGRGVFVAPGLRPHLVQTTSNTPTIRLPERNGQVLGLNIYDINHNIVGENTTNTEIAGNFLVGDPTANVTAHGIWLDGDQRNLKIHANIITGRDNGIRINGNLQGEITDNAIGLNNSSGIVVLGNLRADVIHNLISDNGQRGLVVDGHLEGDVRDNHFDENGHHGLQVVGDVRGTIIDTTVTGNRRSGILIEGDLQGDLIGNDGSDNDQSGFEVIGTVGGDVRNNVAHNNHEYGMRFPSRVTGSVADNSLTGNGYNGLFAGAGVQEKIQGNEISENGFRNATLASQSGLFVVSTIGGPIRDNEFLANEGYGAYLQLDGPQNVLFERNELSDNHSYRGDLYVRPNDDSTGPVTVHLRDNTSEAADTTYPYKTYQRMDGVEFIDDGGNDGRID